MPYDSKDSLPANVKDLAAHLQDIWMAAFNSAWTQYKGDEQKCFAVAWAAVNEARGTTKASMTYFSKIEARAVDGKRLIFVEVMDKRVSRPLSEPYRYRWKVDDKSLDASVETLKGKVLNGPIAGLERGHELKRPVARFVDYEANGSLRAKYELIEDDAEWADYAWQMIQSGHWKYVSAQADFDWNYPVDVKDDIVYPHRFKFQSVDFVPQGAFPNAGVYQTFSEGLAAMLASESSQARPSREGFDQHIGEKKMTDEKELVELQAKHTKELEDIKKEYEAKLDKTGKDLALERERIKILDKKSETVDARTLEAMKEELDKKEKRIADLERADLERKDEKKNVLVTEVADLKVQNGLISSKDAIAEAERLKGLDEPALLELHASLADLTKIRHYLPKTLPNSSGSLKASMDPKERRRIEMFGEYVGDDGNVIIA